MNKEPFNQQPQPGPINKRAEIKLFFQDKIIDGIQTTRVKREQTKQLLPVLKSKINKQDIERTGSSGFIRIVDRFYFRPMHSPKVEKPTFIIKPILKEAVYREKKK